MSRKTKHFLAMHKKIATGLLKKYKNLDPVIRQMKP